MIDIHSLCYKTDGMSLCNLNFKLPSGVAIGIIGNNRCGKSTLVQLLTEFSTPESGQILMFGKPIGALREVDKQRIAIIDPQISYFQAQNLSSLCSTLSDIYLEFDSGAFMNYASLLSLPERKPTSSYSSDQYAKLSFAIALSHNVKLLLLDDAFAALDFESKHTIFKMLRNFMSSGGSILFASHNFSDIGALCDSVALMHKGRFVFEISTDDIIEKYDIVDVGRDDLELLEKSAVIYTRETAYHYEALVLKKAIDHAFLNRRTSFAEITEMLIEYTRNNI